MKRCSVIVLGPGLRRVWKFRFHAGVLVSLAMAMASIVAGTASVSYVRLLSVGNDEQYYRLLVDNGKRSIENRNLRLQVNRLRTRAEALEHETVRILSELPEE